MGVSISAPYIYVCTRMRIRKAKLLPKEEYMRMLNMSISEITRIISETEYKQEIDELGNTFKGIDLLEVALSWNLAKEYQQILDITPGTLKQFTRAYLRYGISRTCSPSCAGSRRVKRPAGSRKFSFPPAAWTRLCSTGSLPRTTRIGSSKPSKDGGSTRCLPRDTRRQRSQVLLPVWKTSLYKQFYAELIADASGGISGGSQFLAFIRLDIDVKNILTLFRLRADKIQEDTKEMYIAGGTITATDFTALNAIQDYREFVDQLRAKVRTGPVVELLKGLETEGPVHEIASLLVRVQMEQLEKLSKRNPFSIYPILVYLEKKKYEVFNLRALARGKESKLPSDTIGKYLVM